MGWLSKRREQAHWEWKRKEIYTRQKTKNLGIIKCCIFIAHSKGEYINGMMKKELQQQQLRCHSSSIHLSHSQPTSLCHHFYIFLMFSSVSYLKSVYFVRQRKTTKKNVEFHYFFGRKELIYMRTVCVMLKIIQFFYWKWTSERMSKQV